MRRAVAQHARTRKSSAFWAPRVAALLLTFVSAAALAQNLTITPTTTLAAETGNNTSASNLWKASSNGDLGPSNVSKVDTHTLMYPGFAGKIYAHLMGWFCMQPGSTAVGAGTSCSSHVQIGYNSNDPAVVHAQVNDMISRGFDGVIHDWYGPNKANDDVETRNYMHEAELHPGFTFALMVDKGAIEWFSCYPNCTATQALTQIMQYAANTFFNSPAYMRINGRPVVTNFDIDLHYTVDWNYVSANTPGNPIFIFQNSSGFTHTLSSGSYSWVIINSQFGLDYLSNFYNTGMQYPSELTVGAMYKGFNDTLASWSGNRVMSQQCGQTWLQTFNEANSLYNAAKPLGAIQLVTWDDYEEGTELETGIDNCVSVSASVSGTVLNWAISGGNENTIDHYTVFISNDGQNLMPLGDFAAGVHSVDIATFNPAAGAYTLYVKAVGKPSISNKMSNAATLTISSSGTGSSVTVTPNSGVAPLTVTASATTSSAALTTAATTTSSTTTIDFGDGTVVNGPSATHTYSAPGNYTVTATTNSNGVTSTATAAVKASAVSPHAVLNLSSTTGAAPATITASTSGSTDPNAGGSISGSVIDWGDGSTATGPSASHVYNSAGTYTVKATVTDNYGTTASASQSVTITGSSVSISSPASGATVGSQVHIVATASAGTGIAAMSTYIDDVKVYKTYTSTTDTTVSVAPGSHHLVINAWDSNGVLLPQASEMFTVSTDNPTATLTLSATTATVPATINATTTATDPNSGGSISSYSINWGDGSAPDTTATASHTYSTAGIYTVTATVIDNYGKTGTATQTVSVTASVVKPNAVLTLSATNGIAPAAITASTSSSTDPNAGGSITSSTIAWGDGSTSAGPSASHTYSAAGTYTITATVTDNFGKSATATQTVTVVAAGVTITSPTTGSSPYSPVHIVATAASGNGIAAMSTYVDYNKVYSTNTASTDTALAVAPGSHLLAINAWDNSGSVMQSTVNFSVPAQAPTATLALSATTAAVPATITATASATDPNVGGTLTYLINWGDGTTSAAASASHTYANAGTYAVTATVTDNYGKSATATQALTVSAPVATAPLAQMAVSMSGPTATVATSGSTAGSGSIASTVISWGDGASTAAASGTHTYAKGGNYTITVTVTNSSGLSNSTSQQVTAAGVVIWLPAPGSNLSEPVHIAATAYDSKTIAAMAVYLDNNKIYSGYVNNLDFWQQMSSGTHTIVINAWEDVTGVVYQSRVTFTAK